MLHGGAEQRLDVEHFSDSSDSLSRMHVLLRSTAVAGSSTSASVEQAFSKKLDRSPRRSRRIRDAPLALAMLRVAERSRR